MNCPVCAHDRFGFQSILWPSLVEAWGLTEAEHSYIDRQQGIFCRGCGCNLRSMALGQALKVPLEMDLRYSLSSEWPPKRSVAMLEVNEAGGLAPWLAMVPGHVRASYPEVDLRRLPYADGAFDLVVHSDTLEHVESFPLALRECLRVLRPGGALCFTVPTLFAKLTRPSPGPGKLPSYHGPEGDESLRVRTEFGADVWGFCLAAGFSRVEITCIEWPSGLAITAWR